MSDGRKQVRSFFRVGHRFPLATLVDQTSFIFNYTCTLFANFFAVCDVIGARRISSITVILDTVLHTRTSQQTPRQPSGGELLRAARRLQLRAERMRLRLHGYSFMLR